MCMCYENTVRLLYLYIYIQCKARGGVPVQQQVYIHRLKKNVADTYGWVVWQLDRVDEYIVYRYIRNKGGAMWCC